MHSTFYNQMFESKSCENYPYLQVEMEGAHLRVIANGLGLAIGTHLYNG